MNVLDIGIVALVLICAAVGYRRGLVMTLYRFVSFFIAFVISRQLYPYVAQQLRGTSLFPALQERVSNMLGLETITNTARSADFIDSLALPQVLQGILHTNYTPAMRSFLNVATIEDYVSAFFANVIINGIAIITVFVLIMVLLYVVGGMLDIVSRLPVIRVFNRVGGLVFGLLTGAILAWVVVIIMIFVLAANPTVYSLVDGSWVVHRLLEVTLRQLAVT